MNDQYNPEYWKERPFEAKNWFMVFQWLEHFEPQSMLDYGCGMGYMVHCWRYYGVDAVGYDISEHAVQNAWESAKGNTFLTIPDGEFDLVTCIDVLEHVEEESAKDILKQLFSKVKSGGYCLMSICMAGDPNFEKDFTHVLKRTRKWWEFEVEQAGFEICEVPQHFMFRHQYIIGMKK